MGEQKSIVTNRPRDCFICKLVGGVGMTGIGAYIALQSRSLTRGYGKALYLTIALGSAGLGVARLFDLPPFDVFNQDSNLHKE